MSKPINMTSGYFIEKKERINGYLMEHEINDNSLITEGHGHPLTKPK